MGGEAHVPLQAVVQGGGGEVGGADVGGGGRGGARETRPMEQPGSLLRRSLRLVHASECDGCRS